MNESYFAFPYHWILFNVSMSRQSLSLRMLRLRPDSDVTVYTYNDTSNDYRLQQSLFDLSISFKFLCNSKWLSRFAVYKIHSKSENIICEPFGKWSSENGLFDERSTRILSRRRRNLMGRTISVSMVLTNNDSINHLHDYRYEYDSPEANRFFLNQFLFVFLTQ